MIIHNKYRSSKDVWRFYKTYFQPGFGNNINALQIAKCYYSNKLYDENPDIIHLKLAMKWLERAQDICHGKGVSAAYYLNRGWDVAYPETSGYIIATFINYSELYNDASFLHRAIEIGDWEIEIQTDGGGVLSNPSQKVVRVFNTGQVILGWCLLYEKTKNNKYLEAAIKAGDFLCRTQESNGTWIQNTYCGVRTYHARIDWALLRLYKLTGNEQYLTSATSNIRWVIEQQRSNGWFDNCGFDDDAPIMHTIAYTLRGLLECHEMKIEVIDHFDILPKILSATQHINEFVKIKPVRKIEGLIPTSIQNNWVSHDEHSCLTGNAQYAIFLYRLAQITGEASHAEIADTIVSALKKTQRKSSDIKEINITGAIAGSYPIYTGYCSNSFPNWAAKFFADALMMKNFYKQGLIILA